MLVSTSTGSLWTIDSITVPELWVQSAPGYSHTSSLTHCGWSVKAKSCKCHVVILNWWLVWEKFKWNVSLCRLVCLTAKKKSCKKSIITASKMSVDFIFKYLHILQRWYWKFMTGEILKQMCSFFVSYHFFKCICYQYKVAQSQYHRSPSGAERSYCSHQGDFKEGNLS